LDISTPMPWRNATMLNTLWWSSPKISTTFQKGGAFWVIKIGISASPLNKCLGVRSVLPMRSHATVTSSVLLELWEECHTCTHSFTTCSLFPTVWIRLGSNGESLRTWKWFLGFQDEFSDLLNNYQLLKKDTINNLCVLNSSNVVTSWFPNLQYPLTYEMATDLALRYCYDFLLSEFSDWCIKIETKSYNFIQNYIR
jgi:hypothetical protein